MITQHDGLPATLLTRSLGKSNHPTPITPGCFRDRQNEVETHTASWVAWGVATDCLIVWTACSNAPTQTE